MERFIMRVPERMKPIVKMFPYLKEFETLTANLFLFPREAETEKNKQRIIKYQENLTKRLIKNAKKSYEKKSEKTRNIRLATKEEKKRYNKITGGLISSLRNQFFLNLLKFGTPKFKKNFLRDMGAKIGKNVFFSPGNLIDTIFTKMISIGDNTIVNVGAIILCHEISLETNELYVGEVNIGSNVVVAPGAIILPGVNIGDNAIVGPGFISYDIEDNFIGIGLPDSVRYPFSEDVQKMIDTIEEPLEPVDATLRDYRKYIPRYSPFNILLLELQKNFFMPQAIRQILLRLAGVKIGKNVIIQDNVTFDPWHPEKISIDDGTVIKSKTVLATHEGFRDTPVRLGEIQIGKNVLVDVGSGILPGVKIEDDGEVMPYSAVITDVEKGKQVEGMPATESGETFDIENFLSQHFGYTSSVWDEIQAERKKQDIKKEKLEENE